MSLNITITEKNHETVAYVRGVTAAKLVEARIGESEGGDQISEIQYGNLTLRIWWSLRETPDNLGRAAAMGWDDRADAHHAEIDMGSIYGHPKHASVSVAKFEGRNSVLKF